MNISTEEIVREIIDNKDNREKMGELYGELIRRLFNKCEPFQLYVQQMLEHYWPNKLYEDRELSSDIEGINDYICENDYFSVGDIEFEFFSGATKGVFSVMTATEVLPYVIKFPNIAYNVNYCQLEANYYADAEKEGLEGYFAECFPIGTPLDRIHKDFDLPFYLQRWCDVDSYETESDAADILMEVNDWYDDIDDALMEVSGVHGKDYTIVYALISDDTHLDDFLFTHDIGDLHGANFGKLDGDYVMVDYSGY